MKTMRSHLRFCSLLAAVSALALGLAACGGGSSSSSSSSAPSGSSAPAGGGGGTPVAVTLRDFSVSMDSPPSAPGTYTFSVSNSGPSAHNLTIDGPGVEDQATPTFGSGDTKTLTVTLQNGTYEFYCSVPGHKQAGMQMKVTVGSGGAAGSSTEDSGGGSDSSGDG